MVQDLVIGIDIGGQTTKCGIVDARGTVLSQTVIRSDNHTDVTAFIAELAEATRTHADVVLGLSPRGALALARAARANACMEGRDYAVPDDVLAVFPDVTAHRLVLSSKARLHEMTAEQITDNILQEVKKPDIREFKTK